MQVEYVLQLFNRIMPGSVYLVGGSVRDFLLGRGPRDMDLVVAGSAREALHRLAETAGIRPVVLDAGHDVMRAVFPGGHVDIAGLGGGSLEENLKRRDFTINAMALPLESYLRDGDRCREIIDPLGGWEDLRRGIIRACSPRAFEDDPVRVLRGMRLQAQLGFTIAPGTVQLMRVLQRPFNAVPGERVWEELRRILELPGSAGIFRFLDREAKILEQIFPEAGPMRQVEQNYYHADNVWEHCLKTLVYFERMLEDNLLPGKLNKAVREYLGQLLTGERKRLPVIKLACLFHDVGKLETRGEGKDGRITFYGHHRAGGPLAEKIGRRLRFSRREIKLLRLLVEWHMQPLFLYKESPPSTRAVIRFFRNLGEETPGCLLLSLADVSSSRMSIGRADLARMYAGYILDLLNRYFEEKERVLNPRPLLSGRDICNIFNLKPSPLVGKLKDALMEAQVGGKVATRREAEEFLRQYAVRYVRGKKI